jgi:hypothetical protein
MADAYILAIDLAKRSFQVCATDRGGSCVDAPRFARGFSDFSRLSASIGRVSGLLMWLAVTTGRYAVRTWRATSVQRAIPLWPRDWLAAA